MEEPVASQLATHTPLGHLVLLVFEAVLEVVCVSLPGYIVARRGMFDVESQKFVANLNVALFTPCLSRLLPGPILTVFKLPTNHPTSFYEACFSTDRLQIAGISHHSRHFPRPDSYLISMLDWSVASLWLQAKTTQLCGRYGGQCELHYWDLTVANLFYV